MNRKDELGNYFITARRVQKEALNQKEYMLVRSGIEPHIEEQTPSLPSGSSLTNKLTDDIRSPINNENITDSILNKAENTIITKRRK